MSKSRKISKKSIKLYHRATQRKSRGGEERKLVDEWKGKLLGNNTRIQIFKIPNSKRKPIIKISGKEIFKNVDGSLLAVRFLPPLQPGDSHAFKNLKGKVIYRISLYYGARGTHQGGPMVGFREHFVLFSDNKKQIDKIGEMLSKYTTDIKHKK